MEHQSTSPTTSTNSLPPRRLLHPPPLSQIPRPHTPLPPFFSHLPTPQPHDHTSGIVPSPIRPPHHLLCKLNHRSSPLLWCLCFLNNIYNLLIAQHPTDPIATKHQKCPLRALEFPPSDFWFGSDSEPFLARVAECAGIRQNSKSFLAKRVRHECCCVAAEAACF